jgi:hypothetical protein
MPDPVVLAAKAATTQAAFADAIAKWRAEVATLSPADQTRVQYAETDLLPLAVDLVKAFADAYLAKLPVFGGLAEGINRELDRAGADLLAMLTGATA